MSNQVVDDGGFQQVINDLQTVKSRIVQQEQTIADRKARLAVAREHYDKLCKQAEDLGITDINTIPQIIENRKGQLRETLDAVKVTLDKNDQVLGQ